MALEPRKVPEEISEEELGSLRGCLVDGDAEQRLRQRRVRRRALAISIALQSAALIVLVLFPLFGRTERTTLAIATPIPPYSSYRSPADNSGARQRPGGPRNVCHICPSTNIPPTIVTQDPRRTDDGTNEAPPEGIGQGIPGPPDALINVFDSRQRARQPERPDRQAFQPRVVHVTQLDPALLIRRVEPEYPILAKQTHREGRVELHAIIATDGTIQSLQIVGGDPMFYLSAREAVLQWRYKPTVLNGQPVEIDTSITVIYTMPH